MTSRQSLFVAPDVVEHDTERERVAHVVAVRGTANDPVRLTLCGITLTDSRHRASQHGLCVVCEALEQSLITRGLR